MASIVQTLRPWREEYSEVEISAAVREQIALLCSVTPEFFSRNKIQETRKGARDIATTIKELKKQIEGASPELGLRIGLKPFGKENAPRRFRARGAPMLLRALDHMHDLCITAAKNQPTAGYCRKHSAGMAATFILKFSTAPLTAGKKGALRTIASLIFEVSTGAQDADIARACRDAVRDWARALRNIS